MLVKKYPLFMQLSQLKNQLEIGIFEVIVIWAYKEMYMEGIKIL